MYLVLAFNIINASYLSQSLEPQRRYYDNYLAAQQGKNRQQPSTMPDPSPSFLFDQSSMNMSRRTPYTDPILASSTQAESLPQKFMTPSLPEARNLPTSTPATIQQRLSTMGSSLPRNKPSAPSAVRNQSVAFPERFVSQKPSKVQHHNVTNPLPRASNSFNHSPLQSNRTLPALTVILETPEFRKP